MSYILLAIFNAIFMGMTMFWGAWYSLSSSNPKDFKALYMPVMLACPRMLVMVGSLLTGKYLCNWTNEQSIFFVALVMGLWLLLVTGEVMYVQTKLRGNK